MSLSQEMSPTRDKANTFFTFRVNLELVQGSVILVNEKKNKQKKNAEINHYFEFRN